MEFRLVCVYDGTYGAETWIIRTGNGESLNTGRAANLAASDTHKPMLKSWRNFKG